ncbi:MAG: helix-turn-helix transcriptional regulator, partial [Ensifer adhaerens]
AERPLQSLARSGLTGVQDLLRRCFEADGPAEPQVESLVELCGLAGVGLNCSRRSNDRVWELLAFIDAGFPEGVSLSQLADRFCLSESRLSHLFADEVGIPLRTYLLWRRYRLAFSRLSGQSTLTRLASDSGFADAAHLTRTFVGYFGFSPRRILHSCFIQDLTRG